MVTISMERHCIEMHEQHDGVLASFLLGPLSKNGGTR